MYSEVLKEEIKINQEKKKVKVLPKVQFDMDELLFDSDENEKGKIKINTRN
jgi:hypothetical protein